MVSQLEGVSWAGHFAGSQVWDVLAEIDVLVIPSRWVENSPNSILEAQAVGVPIVGTNLGGIAELVTHERNGLLFIIDDANDLARQMQRLLDEPQLIARLRFSPLAFRSVEEELGQIAALYQELVEDREAIRV
jgi:glycosyltransferase involved in cell wall biosynthesis